MPKHQHPGQGAEKFHDRTHLSSGKKALTKEQLEHRKRMDLEKRQEVLAKALPHALQILARQRNAIRESMANLKKVHGSQKIVLEKIKSLEKRKKLLLKSALKTQRQTKSYSTIVKKLKELNQVRKQMADGEKKIREMDDMLRKHKSGR